MKYSTALKQSTHSVRFLSVVVPCIWGLYFWTWFWQLAAIAVFLTLYLAMDIWNIISIRRALKNDPEYLKKKIPGT